MQKAPEPASEAAPELMQTAPLDVSKVLTIVNRRYSSKYDIYAGRPTILGNPYSHLASTAATLKVASRDEAVERYEQYAWVRMQHDVQFRDAVLACAGRRVACWCHPLNCHVRAIARLIAKWREEHP